ncbi:chitin synthase, class II, partial [Aureobasidium melanogenum]
MSSCSLGISSSTVPPFEALAAPKSVLTVLKRKFEVCRYSWVACQSKGKTSRNRITMDPKNIFFDPCGRLPMLKMKFIAIVKMQAYRRTVKTYLQRLTFPPVGSIFGSESEPATKYIGFTSGFSQQRIRSSARYMLAVNTSVSSLIVLEGMISNVRHFVLKVLGRHNSTCNVRIVIKCLPEVVQRSVSWSCTDIQQNTDIGLQGLSERIEEPTMTVELLCILLFHAENHLARHNSFLGSFEFEIGIERYLCGILINVTSDFTLREHPELLSAAKVGDIAHDTMHGAGKVEFVFVVHGDTDEQLGLAGCVTNLLTELVATLNKLVGIACDGRVSHVRKFDIIATGQERVQNGGNFALQYQFSIDEFDLLLGHDCRSCATTFLLSIWSRLIVAFLVIIVIVVVVVWSLAVHEWVIIAIDRDGCHRGWWEGSLRAATIFTRSVV